MKPLTTAAAGAPSLRMDALSWGMLFTLAVLWGGTFLLVEVILIQMPVMTLVALRVSLAAVTAWAVILATGTALPASASVWLPLLFLGVINNVIPFSLIVWAQTEVTAGFASILNATTPLWTALIAAVALSDERLTAAKITGIFAGVAGVAVMVGPSALPGGNAPLVHQLAILIATISYAFSAVFARRFARLGVPLLAIAAGQLTGSSLVLVPLAAAVDGPAAAFGAGALVWSAVVVSAVFCTTCAYLLYFSVIRRAGATNAALVTVLVPVVAILGGVTLLGEPLTAQQFWGMAMVAAGLAVMDGRLPALFWRGGTR
ncbi:MAG: DMT family transporter [Pseudomonadota bacterium]